jgi:hypothetical protein
MHAEASYQPSGRQRYITIEDSSNETINAQAYKSLSTHSRLCTQVFLANSEAIVASLHVSTA